MPSSERPGVKKGGGSKRLKGLKGEEGEGKRSMNRKGG